MKLPLLLALLFGAVSALHLGTETSNFESPLGDDTLPQDRDIPERGAMEAPTEGLMLLEGEEEGGSGSEDAPEEEGHVKSDSALEEVDKDFQCPKEEDTITLGGIPGCKTCRLTLVPTAMEYNQAHYTCLNRYRGFLVSIHSFTSNYRIQRLARSVNQGQIWIGGAARGSGRCRSFYWLDGSAWNFWLWARGEPSASGGNCVSMYTQGPLGEQRRGRNPGLFTL
ncbi:bone marrow proteoglycan-like isoform X2 [Equus asinus]|uniref:bone marrow proteoglycan-like isoform X2 n=1 Tax=Equus asinus TaxID=9793 RepID=UPI0038F64337